MEHWVDDNVYEEGVSESKMQDFSHSEIAAMSDDELLDRIFEDCDTVEVVQRLASIQVGGPELDPDPHSAAFNNVQSSLSDCVSGAQREQSPCGEADRPERAAALDTSPLRKIWLV